MPSKTSKALIISLVTMLAIFVGFTALTANGEIFMNSAESEKETVTATSRELESAEVEEYSRVTEATAEVESSTFHETEIRDFDTS